MTTETGSLPVDDLAGARTAAKTLWESGLLQPHEKTHLWEIIGRIDRLMADASEHAGSPGEPANLLP